MEYFWVGIGGFLGANARFVLGREITQRVGTAFPFGTMLVNLSGAFLIGVLFTLLADRTVSDPMWRQLAIVGFLGGYTTFSTYTIEAVGMAQDGKWMSALTYVVGSNLVGLLACFAGIWMASSR